MHYYSSTMSGAPTFGASTGSLNALLKACLVTGFGSEAAQGSWNAVESGSVITLQSTDTRLLHPSYLRVDDSNAGYANVIGYETMTDVNTGSYPFPTAAQLSGGGYVVKQSAARPWVLFADSQAFYLMSVAPARGSISTGIFFGDVVSYGELDHYSCALLCATTNSTPPALLGLSVSSNTSAWVARSYSGVGGSVHITRQSHGITSSLGQGTQAYPSVVDGNLHAWPVEAWEETSVARGLMPGLWNPIHTTMPTDGNVISGSGAMDGRVLYVGRWGTLWELSYAIDLTGPWR